MEVVYYVASSLDGYIATAGGGIEWLRPFEQGGEDYGYADFYASIDCVLLGRHTYEQSQSLGEWPYPKKPCWVFSRTRNGPSEPGVRFTANAPRVALAEAEGEGCKRAWLVGGGKLAAAFRADGLISEHIVSVIPVLLGGGIPLFDGPGQLEWLNLAESRIYPSGIVQLRYRKGAS